MMKHLIFFLLLVVPLFAGAQKNPYLSLSYDSVVMYEFDGGKGSDMSIINDSGGLARTVSMQALLPVATSRELVAKLGARTSYGQTKAFCYEPHLGFVFYKHGKSIAYVNVCLDCNRLVPSMTIPAQRQGVTVGIDSKDYTGGGMGHAFSKWLNDLALRYKFRHRVPERGKK
jgi:hypothetical protein